MYKNPSINGQVTNHDIAMDITWRCERKFQLTSLYFSQWLMIHCKSSIANFILKTVIIQSNKVSLCVGGINDFVLFTYTLNFEALAWLSKLGDILKNE